jgi:hypothetical protein
MSYDLYFWNQNAKCESNPNEVMEALNNGIDIIGLERLPTDDILKKIKQAFPEISENKTTNPSTPMQLLWDSPKDNSCFLIDWSNYHIGIEGHDVDGDIYNKIIDIMLEYNCPLYDPQTETRYSE